MCKKHVTEPTNVADMNRFGGNRQREVDKITKNDKCAE